MPDPKRNELARVLADIDQCLAKAERIAPNPEHDDRRGLYFLTEFQEALPHEDGQVALSITNRPAQNYPIEEAVSHSNCSSTSARATRRPLTILDLEVPSEIGT